VTLASAQFLVFLTLVYLLWRYVARGDSARKWLLLGASYAFYATWDARFLLFLLAITVFQWVIGARIAGENDPRRRRLWLAASLILALGVLAYCKYVGFFVNELSTLLSALGLGSMGPIGRTIVPIGISFYTFQSLTYTIDIYRGQAQPTRSLRDFALFIAFFGHVTAGPISRARLLIPQLASGPAVAPSLDAQAVFLIARGLVKKLAIADVLAAEFVSPAFSTPGDWSSAFLVMAVVAYSFQIYMDVSGYTDLARGAGRCFGYDLAINFDRQ
jgi:D-alanyl-lipoteichoic acid acyltransferase DltB (MBOAT superfamily)